MNRAKGPPTLKVGSRASVTVVDDDGESHAIELPTEKSEENMMSSNGEEMVVVGVSASIGESTEYAREKYEITAWCSMPCEQSDECIENAKDAAYEIVESELVKRQAQLKARFFPGTTGGNS